MAVDKDLFLYDLAIVAILKNEGRYLKEWLDYHLLAGVEHFYLYDNDSTDNQAEVVKPYVAAGLVDYISAPGKAMQMQAYNDAVADYRFQSRYIAFIDGDEFIYPKTNRPIVEVVDEILLRDPNAAGLAIHWQLYGSNRQVTADYSKGVLERFTRRAEKNFWEEHEVKNNMIQAIGNGFLKVIVNPRRVKQVHTHYAIYFDDYHSVNESGLKLSPNPASRAIVEEKIAINHYFTKSREEFDLKRSRGRAYSGSKWSDKYFDVYDRNEVFDNGILKYRAARAENFSLESDKQRFNRVTDALIKTLSLYADEKISDLETALTCRALSHYLKEKVFEEASLAAILKSLDGIKISDVRLLLSELPKLLNLPYPIVEDLRGALIQIISQTMDFLREKKLFNEMLDLSYLRRLLKAWR